jgi:hypothetical protein
MQVDFYFQLLRRFHPRLVTQTLRAAVRNFIKETNLDTFERCSEIYDWVACAYTCGDDASVRSFARDMRTLVDRQSRRLIERGEGILNRLEETWVRRDEPARPFQLQQPPIGAVPADRAAQSFPQIPGLEFTRPGTGWEAVDLFGVASAPVPYDVFRARLAEEERETATVAGAACQG